MEKRHLNAGVAASMRPSPAGADYEHVNVPGGNSPDLRSLNPAVQLLIPVAWRRPIVPRSCVSAG